MKLRIFTILGSFALLLIAGCASDFESTSSGSEPSSESTSSGSESSSGVDTSSIDEFNANQQRINEQMALDAANAAAFQQNAGAMAAAQQTENQANAQFNQNGLQ
ncbi:MAG TPA: hypothetical protein VKS98_09090 [Chthoniobacterales bacterium]|nr:hypothetical protein [Chthoniobacterales bacterium]